MKCLRLTVLLALVIPVWASALPWDEDMRDQPSVKAQETRVPAPAGSVPAGGGEAIGAPADTGELVQLRLRAQQLINPVGADDASVERGRAMYDLHCLTCHGSGGKGDGPVGKKYQPTPMDLTLSYVQTQPDGQLFFTITHGSIAMPAYRESMAAKDRWHLVNYIKRALAKDAP